MTSGQKVALALLISALAFCAFTIVAFSGFFDILEVNFYRPVAQEKKETRVREIVSAQSEYFDILISRFSDFAANPSVRSYADSRPEDFAVRSRESLRSRLAGSVKSFFGLRIVDNDDHGLYFSTFSSDVISGPDGISYRNYDSSNDIAFESVKSESPPALTAEPGENARIIKDGVRDRIIFSLPFRSGDERAGTALFYCDAAGFSEFLLGRNLIDGNGLAALVTPDYNSDNSLDNFGGFVLGLPDYDDDSLRARILEKWRDGESLWTIDDNPQNVLLAFSVKAGREDLGFITLLYGESELKFPYHIKFLLLVTAFITLYLAVFLILSIRRGKRDDDIVVTNDKIRRYEEYFFAAYSKLEDKNPGYLEELKKIVRSSLEDMLGEAEEDGSPVFDEEPDEIDEIDEAESVEEPGGLEDYAPAEKLEELEEVEEVLQFGMGPVESGANDFSADDFVTVDRQNPYKDLDAPDETPDSSSERDSDMERTLAALPERAPSWNYLDELELDSDGLSRKLSLSEQHDVQKLKDAAQSIDKLDSELEELESFSDDSDSTLIEVNSFIPSLLESNIDADDEIYKDEVLLERIEFGVPDSGSDDSYSSVGDTFAAFQLDYSFLDEDEAVEKMYEEGQPEDIKDNEHFFENKSLLRSEEEDDGQEKDSAREEVSVESEREIQIYEPEIAGVTELDDAEESESLPEPEENSAPETVEKVRESAEIQDEEADELENLEISEKDMPFVFTQFAQNTKVDELYSFMGGEAIVQDTDGTFRVTEFPMSVPSLSLDKEFKKLVDSILR